MAALDAQTERCHMNQLELTAGSRAAEAGYVALRDIATLADKSGIDYRLVGGQMVSLHVAAAGVMEPVVRLTLDADLGVEPAVAADPAIVSVLSELGYCRPGSANRFERTDSHGRELIIDLLTASYTGRLVTNASHGDMVLDAIPGLSLALALPGESLDLRVHLMDSSVIEMTIVVPSVLAALCVKAVGWADGGPRRMLLMYGDSCVSLLLARVDLMNGGLLAWRETPRRSFDLTSPR